MGGCTCGDDLALEAIYGGADSGDFAADGDGQGVRLCVTPHPAGSEPSHESCVLLVRWALPTNPPTWP